ncbi:ABC transporter ATP-binding protein [Candidatus Nitrosocosmicus hydrocola]|uniref:ABC transporter ATP-binding protein n=1 Tax=Candidatus Nitrosocosmicus hydrocola TaxID=1826872 RepID=UPI001E622619|nr:ABC transporter ATP-binding protein [Candidatus Nitrosocosmicus hydrocola]
MSDPSAPILKVERIYKSYVSSAGEMPILKNINFEVGRGEFVSIVGPSGSGKSTLLNILGTLDRPTEGDIFIDGEDVFSLDDHDLAYLRNNAIGFIFQSYNLINRASVLKNIEIPCIIAGLSKSERLERASKIMGLLGIEDKGSFKPFNLSGGQQQRVAIARALMNNPSIILADEPTGNLDTKTGNEVFNLLKMLSNKYDRTIVMVTHNPELAEKTDRIIHLKDGEIEREERIET